MKNIRSFFAVLALVLPALVYGQKKPQNICGSGNPNKKSTITLRTHFTLNKDPVKVEVWDVNCELHKRIFNRLIAAAGLHASDVQLREENDMGLATYLMATDAPYIVYTYSDFPYKGDNDTLATEYTSAVAHELGHYLNHHEDSWVTNKKNEKLELSADYFIGFLLERLGYTKKQAQSFLATTQDSVEGYPSKAERRIIIERGFNNSRSGIPAAAFAGVNPRVVWYQSTPKITSRTNYKVAVSDDTIRDTNDRPWNLFGYKINKIVKNWVGILYDSATNATYQLNLDVPTESDNSLNGTGRLVNNRTSFTYYKTAIGGYEIVNRGEEVRRSECKNVSASHRTLGFDDEEVDYLIYCKDEKDNQWKYILLTDYGLASVGQLMPAMLVNDISFLHKPHPSRRGFSPR